MKRVFILRILVLLLFAISQPSFAEEIGTEQMAEIAQQEDMVSDESVAYIYNNIQLFFPFRSVEMDFQKGSEVFYSVSKSDAAADFQTRKGKLFTELYASPNEETAFAYPVFVLYSIGAADYTIRDATFFSKLFVNEDPTMDDQLVYLSSQILFEKMEAWDYHEDSNFRIPTYYLPGATKNFYISVDVNPVSIYPSGKGACRLVYSNIGETSKTNFSETVFAVNDKGLSAKVSTTEIEFEVPLTIPENTAGEAADADVETGTRLEIIRYFGHTFFFSDGVYLGQTEDGLDNRMMVSLQPYLELGGEYAGCEFDNLVIRKVYDQQLAY